MDFGSILANLPALIAEFPQGIIIHNSCGEIEYLNPKAESILGISFLQAKGRKSINSGFLTDGKPFPEAEHPYMVALCTGDKVENVTMGISHPTLKKNVYLKLSSIPHFDTFQKKVINIVTVFEDITEKIEAEKFLAESERAMNSFLDNLPGIAYRCKVDEKWTMQFISQGCKEITGYSAESFINNKEITFAELIHPEDRLRVQKNILGALEACKKFDIEYRIITADDQIKHIREYGKAIYENDSPAFMEGLLEDVTDQKKSEQELIEKDLAITSSLNAVALTDISGRMTYVNNSFLIMWGYNSENEVLGRFSVEFWNSPLKIKRVINILLEKGKWQGELSAVKKNGRKFIVFLSASLIYDENKKPSKMMASFINITREKQLKDDLRRKLFYEKTISNISALFIGSFHLNQAINNSFEIIGTALQASHVFLFLINSKGDAVDNTHEWCARGVPPHKHLMQNLPLSDFPWWKDKLQKNEAIQIKKVSLMPAQATSEKEILKNLNIKSLLVLPLHSQKKLLGFFGFDYTEEYQTWENEDLILLRMLENIYSNAFTRKKAENKLKQSERKFRDLFFKHTAPKLILDPVTGNIVEANASAALFLGYSEEELSKMNLGQITVDDNRVLQNRLKHLRQIKQYNENIEIRVQDGSIKYIEVFSSMIKFLQKDMIHSVFFDVTEKKILENKLVLFHKAIEQSPEGIVITNNESRILFVNPMFLKNTGYSVDDVLGKKIKQFISGNQDENFFKQIWETISAGKNWYGELINKKKNGQLYWEEVSISPILNDKKEITHYVAINQDITENKKNQQELLFAKEKAEESDRLKSSFLASISHELRTPLNVIIGFSGIINEIANDHSLKEYSKAINDSGLNLLEIIENLFIVAFEEYQATLNPKGFRIKEVSEVIESIIHKELEVTNKKETIQVIFKKDKHLLEQQVTADLKKITKIMGNLIKNAVKFTEKGKIELIIGRTENSELVFSVEDTGIGIPVDKQDVLFKLFRQADDSHTRKYGGVGLGLAIAQKLARVLKGKITWRSEPGKGSEFRFILPVEWYENIKVSNVEQHIYNHSILVVEDDPNTMLLMKQILSAAGAKIYKAENGRDAVEIVNSGIEIDLIFMDMKMPVMDGYEATAIIKSINSSIPVVSLTAYSFDEDKRKMIQSGCDDVLTKPVRKDMLYGILSKFLKKQVEQGLM